jgi:tRNA-splicing ligase RtcB
MIPPKPNAIVETWLIEPLSRDVAVAIQKLAEGEDVERIAIMPDVHLANDVCIGTVLGTKQLIYPNAIGGDIGCGMSAIAFDAQAELLSDERAAAAILSGLYAHVPGNRHGRATCRELPVTLNPHALSQPHLSNIARRDGRVQYGTLGRGNHFLEFQRDESNRLWLMIHSGSRAIGPAIRDTYLALSQSARGGFKCLNSECDVGQAYLNDVQWARRYASENRRLMSENVISLMKRLFTIHPAAETYVDADHNHVEREIHYDAPLWIHRKGANRAATGMPGIIPGSMGSPSFHVEGRGNCESLCSSSHGAGRSKSRSDARKTISARQFERQLSGIWFDHRRVHALREEAPDAYKDINSVMRAQRDLVRVSRKLYPLLSYKG